MNYKKILTFLIQFFILLILIYFIKQHVQFNQLMSTIHHIDYKYMMIVFLILNIQFLVCALRWKVILNKMLYQLPLWPCLGAITISSFINTSLPVLIGGDFIRIWIGTLHHIKKIPTLISVLADRILNAAGQAFLILIVGSITFIDQKSSVILNIGLSMSTLVILGLVGISFLKFLTNFMPKNLQRIMQPLLNLSQQIPTIFECSKKDFQLIGWIIGCHLLSLLTIYSITTALQLNLSFGHLFLPISIALLITAFPITPGGWGIRETVMIIAFHELHVPAQTALAISVIFGISQIISSIPLSLIWYLNHQINKLKYDSILNRLPQ